MSGCIVWCLALWLVCVCIVLYGLELLMTSAISCTLHKDKGGHPKQPIEEVIKFQIGL